ncbi:MAG: 23S rRNA (adenine(2503)-C(2))-methyltransferase RlmN [Bacteroidales bacterium]|nr:23S rRNA (adenine(2503)-C(2))-methyltransferase RlmN [Bacteroidales bacterium]
MKKNLLGLSLEELTLIATELGLPKFVGKQICGWIYDKHVKSIDEMTNLSKVARARLAEEYEVGCSAPVDRMESRDGTVKYLYRTADGHYIETVYIPDFGNENRASDSSSLATTAPRRATLCVSCQVGCKMKCEFCMTGRQGFVAHLSAADILNQIYSLPQREWLTNIVFMGQGEPFDNLDAVLRATEVLTAPWGYAWSPRRITVSSVGLAKGLVRFLDESHCNLAISLHHPIPAERSKIMPAERALSIEEVVRVLAQYDFCRKTNDDYEEGTKQRRLTFEYIVFHDLNDSDRHADALLRLLAPLDCRVNLIRFHAIPNTPFRTTDEGRLQHFCDYLNAHGLLTTIRASCGQDIYAACGLLTTKKQEENGQ